MLSKISLLLILFFLNMIAKADVYRIVNDGPEALQLRIDLIEQAQKEILISTFIFDQDQTGLQVMGLLREASKRGVEIKILADDTYNWVKKPMRTYLLEQGIKMREYNPIKVFKPSSWSKRSHDKIMLVDGKRLVMGGRNIEDIYYDQGKAGENFQDRDVYVEGAVTNEVRNYFLTLWEAPHVEYELQKRVSARKMAEQEESIDEALDNLDHHPVLKRNTGTDWSQAPNRAESFFLHDPISLKEKKNRVKHSLKSMLDKAEHSIWIETPYLVLTKDVKELFRESIARGLKIRITTTNLNTTDGLLTYAAYMGQKKEMVKMGIELFEYNGPYHLHSKSAVIDDKIALIGSYNLDPRSENINTETLIGIEDVNAASDLLASFDYDLSQSYQIDEKGMPMDKSLGRFAKAPPGKVIAALLLHYTLAPLFKNQL